MGAVGWRSPCSPRSSRSGWRRLNPSPAAAVAAAVVAVGAGRCSSCSGARCCCIAAVATAGVAVLGHGMSSNVGWFAVCLLAAWCVLIGGRRDGLVYLAGALALFAVEWLWVEPDPGWGAWMAGTTLTVLAGLLIRHEIDLVSQLRAAQAGLAERARAEERNRIARELHDVIAHTLTVSLLHVTSARLAVEHDPADAARALAEAERLGQESLAEVRLAVGMLHQHGDTGPHRTAAGRGRPARAGGAVPVRGRRRHPHRRRRHRPAARHHRPGRLPHPAGGADQRGQARARCPHRGAAGRRRGRGRGWPWTARPSRAPAPGWACSACVSGPSRWAAAARLDRAAGAGWCRPRSPSPPAGRGRTRHDPGAAGRRPGAGAGRPARHPAYPVRLRRRR